MACWSRVIASLHYWWRTSLWLSYVRMYPQLYFDSSKLLLLGSIDLHAFDILSSLTLSHMNWTKCIYWKFIIHDGLSKYDRRILFTPWLFYFYMIYWISQAFIIYLGKRFLLTLKPYFSWNQGCLRFTYFFNVNMHSLILFVPIWSSWRSDNESLSLNTF